MFEGLKDAIRSWVGPDLATYSYDDLATATNNFHIDHRIGSGAAGVVYRGVLRGGTDCAIKVLKAKGDAFSFDKELKALTWIRHPNIVALLGYGQNDGWKYIVCELLKGGSVARRLWRCRTGKQPFPWHERLRVARDASCGLSYMVNSVPRVFHRDIKPSNILLDEHGIAKLSDFGLVDIAVCESTLVVDDISGTPGYICPVYYETGEVRESSEVFSFGVVLLELLVNKDAASLGPGGVIVYPLSETLQYMHLDPYRRAARVMEYLDFQAKWPVAIAGSISQLALLCVGELAHRPSFLHIVRQLRHISTNSLVGLDASYLKNEDYGCRTVIPADLNGESSIPTSFLTPSSEFQTILPSETSYSLGESIAQSLGAAWSNMLSLHDHFGWIEQLPSARSEDAEKKIVWLDDYLDPREQLSENITSEPFASPADLHAELEPEPSILKTNCRRTCNLKSRANKFSL